MFLFREYIDKRYLYHQHVQSFIFFFGKEILRVYSKRTMRTTFSRKNEIFLVVTLNLGASSAYAWNNISSTLRHKGARANRLQRAEVGIAGCYTKFHWSAEIPRKIILQLLSYRHPYLSFRKENVDLSVLWILRLEAKEVQEKDFFSEWFQWNNSEKRKLQT